MAGLAGPDRQSGGQVGLPGARRAQEDDVLLAGDEVQGAQVGDGLPLQSAGVVVVEVLQALARGETGGADPALTAVDLPGGDLALQAGGEELLMGPGLLPGALGQPLDRLPQGGRLQRPGQVLQLAGDSATTFRGARRRSGPTALRGRGPGGDGPTGPRRRTINRNRTPAPVVRKIVHLRWKQRLGPVAIADKLGMPASTVHAVLVRCRLNRLTHVDRATGEPIRRYEHAEARRPDPRRRQEARQGPRRRRLALRRPPTGRQEPLRHRGPHRRTPQQVPPTR